MAQNDSAGTAAFKNPLDGLKKPQVRQLARTVQRLTTINEGLAKAHSTLGESRFTVKAGYSDLESAKAVKAARAAEKVRDKSLTDLNKINDKFKDNPPMKAALAFYQDLAKASAAGNPAARNLLNEVNADLTFAVPPAPTRAKGAASEVAIEDVLNGIAGDQAPAQTLAQFVEDRALPFDSTKDGLNARIGYDAAAARGEIRPITFEDQKQARESRPRDALDQDQETGKRREINEFLEPARKAFPPSLLARYALRGNEVVDKRTDIVAFVDSGKELRTKGDVGRDVIDAMLETAESRGWAPLKVFGTEAFKAAVWMEAASRGMDVTGYKPSSKELEVAAQNRQLNGRDNAIAADASEAKPAQRANSRLQDLATAFQEAGTARQQSRAAKAFPELGNAFALLATFEKAIAKPGLARNDSRDFVDQFKELVVDRLQAGKPLPTVTLAEPEQQKAQQVQHDPER